jgi:CBS domain-containing protein
MSKEVITIMEDQDVQEAAALMQSKQIRRVLVVNREKRPVGMLSLADLARHVPDPKLTGVTVEEVSAPSKR